MTSYTSEYLFVSSDLFAPFKGRSLPRQGICEPECIVLTLTLIEATLVSASS